MNRGFQTICFALSLSFAVPGYAIDKQDVAASQEPPSASDSAAGSESPSTSAQAEDCQGPQGNRRSSICAEWKAADAAADSAKWAQWALAVGGLGVLLGAGTLFAAFRAAHWAKIAAAHTEEGSKGAVQAANESRLANQISQGVQRAWVTIAANPQSSQRTETGHSFRFEIISENVGQTPATHFELLTQLFFNAVDVPADMLRNRAREIVEAARKTNQKRPNAILAPGERETAQFWKTVDATELVREVMDGFLVGNVFLVVANYYRTVPEPSVQQIAWRTFLIGSIQNSGERLSTLRLDKDFKAEQLHAMPESGMMHCEFPDEPD